ncbi:MAG: hypothetical protein IKW96_14755 [Ruminococcus sp.]|uniref:dockerin type I domain-containing protein n=1 Tax=Ruminococcus sp. TaxID=41978 RepID=UPI0025DFCE8B|nr:dockerin type I domain-containing protein [Ruminococcus sp.]MBR5684512.1 hypothetical protein [Ruminococcus sp.]
MKKLISAVTSLCMAASMVSAVVPATVGAADASKGFAIKTYDISKPAASDAKSSITINKKDIPADGYVIPSAVYYSEGTNKTDSLLVAITTDSKDISFKLYNPTKEGYTDSEKEYTLGGDTFSTSSYISFAGSYDDLDGYAAAGKYVFGIDSSQSAAGTDNYFIGCSWTNNGKDYKWAGEKSDSYPFYVFDTVIPANIAEGEYTIKFCEYNTDASGVNDNPSPLVEGEKTRFTTKDKTLNLETMKIVVKGDGEEQATTTEAPKVTTTTTVQKQETTTTKPVVQDGDIQFTFADKNGNSDITASAGEEITIYANVKAGGKPVSAMDVQFKATNGLEITQIGGKATALEGVAVSTNPDEYRANFTSTDDSGEPIVPADGKAAFTLKVKVPADAKDATYTIGFADQCKVFKDSTNFNYKTSFAPATIKVGGGSGDVTTEAPKVTTTTTAPKQETTTTTKTVVQDGDIQFTFADNKGNTKVNAKAGDEITVVANVKADGKPVSAMDVQFAASKGLTITQIGSKSAACGGSAVSTNPDEYRANFTSTDDSGEPIVPADGKAAFTLKVKVDADAKDGTYTIGFADQCKVFKDSTNFNYKTSFAPLEIVVGDEPVVETTTTTTTTTTTKKEEKTTTTTTEAPKTTTTSTTTAPKTNGGDGKKVWGDANEDGDVNVCDVVLVLTYISDSSIDYFTEQGKINADVAGEKGITSEDSETLIKYCLKQINKPE